MNDAQVLGEALEAANAFKPLVRKLIRIFCLTQACKLVPIDSNETSGASDKVVSRATVFEAFITRE